MYNQLVADMEPAVYTEQQKPRGKKRKAVDPQQERDAEPDLAADASEDEATDAASKVAKPAAAGLSKAKAAAKGKAKGKAKAKAKAKAAGKREAPSEQPAEPAEPARETAETEADSVRDPGDQAVADMLEMSLDTLAEEYGAQKAPEWVSGNNIYSNAYRKATDRAKLTKEQAKLRARVSSAIFRKSKLVVPSICGPFTKQRARKQKPAADVEATMEKAQQADNEIAETDEAEI